jgi:hypothetical protein
MSHPAVIMPGMDMIDTNDLVSTLYEPCVTFAGDGSPVCERCGWLADEHAAGLSSATPIASSPRASSPSRSSSLAA